MTGQSEGNDLRRKSSRQSACALVALALPLLLLFGFATAQSPNLAPPVSNAGTVANPQIDSVSELPPISAGTPSVSAEVVNTSTGSKASTNTYESSAPPSGSNDLATALERRGDLNLHNLSLNAALFTISEQWNVNIVAGEVQGTVNGVFKQAPLREILDSILLSNGYNYRIVGKSLVVSSVESLGQANPFFQSATIPVQSADIDEVVEGAKLLSTPQGQVQAMKSAHCIMVLDFPDRVNMIREFVSTIDGAGGADFGSPGSRTGKPLDVAYVRTQYISARAAEQSLQAVISKSGRVGMLEREDRLLIVDFPENIAMVKKVLERIDHPRPQVRISALIYDISLQDIEQLGINWSDTIKSSGVNADGDPNQSLGIDSVMSVPFGPASTGSTLTFMNLSQNLDITAVVLALQGAKDSRLLADPHVAVLDNEEAIFQSVSEIPYQQLTETQQGGNIGTTAFKDAGITLRVKPKIAADGTIEMIVKPEFSRLTGFTPGDNQPIIDRRTTETVLRVANRQTVVIGGLRQRSDVGDFKGVPYLKDIRLIGRLFRSRSTDVRESELVVFIMPDIIGYDDDPNVRQQMVADTIRCRLDRVPEAEGCPPCCRRLPEHQAFGEMTTPEGAEGVLRPEEIPFGDPASPPVDRPPVEYLPLPPQSEDLPPLTSDLIPTYEPQINPAGRNELVRTMLDSSRLRRLPNVETAVIEASAITGTTASFPANAFAPPVQMAPAPLQPGTEAHYRAAARIFTNQQRDAEQPATPAVHR